MNRPRVLVIDPTVEAQALIQKVLGKHCDLIFQSDPLLTFDALELFEPDLVILELILPCLSGFDLMHFMRSESALQSIPIMVFSSAHDVENQKLAYRLGATHFLAKPCRPSQLFKGAVLIARRALGHCQAKRLELEEVRQALARRATRQHHHPFLEAAAAHERHRNGKLHFQRSIIASVVNKRPADRW
jgi:PleD family two-component response regulator